MHHTTPPTRATREPEPTLKRAGRGCAVFVVLVAALATGLGLSLPERFHTPLDGQAQWALCAAAAFCWLAAAWMLWGMAAAWGWRGAAERERVRRATEDRRSNWEGRVLADAAWLTAPLSGTPCVAYAYRLSRQDLPRHQRGRAARYGGYACTAFTLDVGGTRVPVRATPLQLDDWHEVTGASALERARSHVAQTVFEPRAGGEGVLDLVDALSSDLCMQPLSIGQVQRRDWSNPDFGEVGTGQLRLEERLLTVGATVTLAGRWDPVTGTVVVSATPDEATLVAATNEGRQRLQLHLGPGPQRSGTPAALFVISVLLVVGSGAYALARAM